MAKGLITHAYLEDTADAIRVLRGESDTYTPDEFGEKIIDAIPTETASGNPIHITDAAAYPAESVVTTLEPVQDLHGYDKPWPAGGGKNLLPITAKSETVSGVTFTVNKDNAGNVVSVTVNGTATSSVIYTLGTYTLEANTYILNGCPTGGGSSTFYIDWRSDSDVQLRDEGEGSAYRSDGQTGKYARIIMANGTTCNNLVFKPMIRLASVTDPTFEPYSNECPISGHTGVELTRTGKNLFDDEFEIGKIDWATGQNASDASCIRSKNYSPIKGGLTCYFSIKNGSTDGREGNIFWYDADKNFISATYATNVYPSTLTKTAPDNAAYVRVSPYASYGTTYNNDIGINYPATATEYEPYQGETHSITFPQAQSPVYGCEVDWTEGVLRVTEVSVTYDGSADEVYDAVSGVQNFELLTIIPYPSKEVGYTQVAPKNISNYLTAKSRADLANSIEGFAQSGSNLRIYMDNFTSIEDFRNYFKDNPLQVVYELATPLEIALTPEVITLLKGENNAWTDSGTSEIEYKVDLNSYIQKLIAEASAQASALSVSPLSLGRSAVLTSTDGADGEEIKDVAESAEESEEVEKLPVEGVESVDEADEVEGEPAEDKKADEPAKEKEPDEAEEREEPEDLTVKKETVEELAETEKVENIKETEENESEVEE